MAAYYNEHDKFAAAWLRELIKAGHIADGEVDERSIEDVLPNELTGFTQCHFFAGIGVWSCALRNAGWSDDRPVWTGSCPCQPFSTAGKGNGFADERHLWPAFYWLIDQCRPTSVLGEQVASADGLDWLQLVSTDLEASGYAFGAADLCAAGFGAPQIRQRLFWVAHSDNARSQGLMQPVDFDVSEGREITQRRSDTGALAASVWDGEMQRGADGVFRQSIPGIQPFNYGAANRVGAVCGFGNAIVPQVAQGFIESVMDYLVLKEVK